MAAFSTRTGQVLRVQGVVGHVSAAWAREVGRIGQDVEQLRRRELDRECARDRGSHVIDTVEHMRRGVVSEREAPFRNCAPCDSAPPVTPRRERGKSRIRQPPLFPMVYRSG
jgi:hypothetical protein